MINLMDADDEREVKKEEATTAASDSATIEALWMRSDSDRVDFDLSLR